MNEEKKLEIHRMIREIDKALEYVKTLPRETRTNTWKDNLSDAKLILVGFLQDLLLDEQEAFTMKEIQEYESKKGDAQ